MGREFWNTRGDLNSEGLGISAMNNFKQEKLPQNLFKGGTWGWRWEGGKQVGMAKGWEANAAGCVCSGCRTFPLIVLQAKDWKVIQGSSLSPDWVAGKDWPFLSPWGASQRGWGGQGSTRMRNLGLRVSHKPWVAEGEEMEHNCLDEEPVWVGVPHLFYGFVTVLHCAQCQKCCVQVAIPALQPSADTNKGCFHLESQFQLISNLIFPSKSR